MGKFDDLPGEIMSDILSGLPIQSALDCKLVSKPWRHLICHPSFSQLHLNHHLKADDDKLCFLFMSNRLHFTEYDETSDTHAVSTTTDYFRPPAIISGHYVLGSVNGLICFNACYGDDWVYYQPAYICNPVTREYVMLPKLEREVQVMCGFGCIPSTNVYKVVRMYELPDKRVQVEVYTLGSGQGWRDIGQLEQAISCYLLPGVFANGAVHWLNTEQNIVAFDLADEKVSQFPSPTISPLPDKRLSLGLLGDNLCATYGNSDRFCSYNPYRRNHDNSFDIWSLKKNKDDHGMSWIKQFHLVGYEPFAFTKNGGLLCYGGDRKNIYHYDPKDASSKMIMKCGYLNLEAVLHKNTLVCLSVLGETDTQIMECGERARSIQEIESNASE